MKIFLAPYTVIHEQSGQPIREEFVDKNGIVCFIVPTPCEILVSVFDPVTETNSTNLYCYGYDYAQTGEVIHFPADLSGQCRFWINEDSFVVTAIPTESTENWDCQHCLGDMTAVTIASASAPEAPPVPPPPPAPMPPATEEAEESEQVESPTEDAITRAIWHNVPTGAGNATKNTTCDAEVDLSRASLGLTPQSPFPDCISHQHPDVAILPSGHAVIAFEELDADGFTKIKLWVAHTSVKEKIYYYRSLSFGKLVNDPLTSLGIFEVYDDLCAEAMANITSYSLGFLTGPLKGKLVKITAATRTPVTGVPFEKILFNFTKPTGIEFPDANDFFNTAWFLIDTSDSTLPTPNGAYVADIIDLGYHESAPGIKVNVANPSVAVPQNADMIGQEQHIYVTYQANINDQWDIYVKAVRLAEEPIDRPVEPVYNDPFNFSSGAGMTLPLWFADYDKVIYTLMEATETPGDSLIGRFYMSITLKNVPEDEIQPIPIMDCDKAGSGPQTYVPKFGASSSLDAQYVVIEVFYDLSDAGCAADAPEWVGRIGTTYESYNVVPLPETFGIEDLSCVTIEESIDTSRWCINYIECFQINLFRNNYCDLEYISAMDTSELPLTFVPVELYTLEKGGRTITRVEYNMTTTFSAEASATIGGSQSSGASLFTGEMDFLFIIDYSGSMEPEIADVRTSVGKFASDLRALGCDVRFGLLAFGSTTEPTVIESCRKVFISTGHSYMDSWMWDGLGYAGSGVTTGFTADDAVFAAATSHWRIAGGTEPGFSAIQWALNGMCSDTHVFDWRPTAKKFVFLITDEPSADQYGAVGYPQTYSAALTACQENQCVVLVGTETEVAKEPSGYVALSAATGWLGPPAWFDISGPFSGIFDQIINYIVREVIDIKIFRTDLAIWERDEPGLVKTYFKKARILLTYDTDLLDIWTQEKNLLEFQNIGIDLAATNYGVQPPYPLYTEEELNGVGPVHLLGNYYNWVYFIDDKQPTIQYPDIGYLATGKSDNILIGAAGSNPKIVVNSLNDIIVGYESYAEGVSQIKIVGTGDFAQASITGPACRRITKFPVGADFAFRYDLTGTTDGVNQLCDMVVDQSNVLHVVWQSNRDGSWEIYYANGVNCFEHVRVTKADGRSSYPRLDIDDTGKVYVVYHDNRYGVYEIMLSHKLEERVMPLLQQDAYNAAIHSGYIHSTNILPITLQIDAPPPTPGFSGLYGTKVESDAGNNGNYLFLTDTGTAEASAIIDTSPYEICTLASLQDGSLIGITCDNVLLTISPYAEEYAAIQPVGTIGPTRVILTGLSVLSLEAANDPVGDSHLVQIMVNDPGLVAAASNNVGNPVADAKVIQTMSYSTWHPAVQLAPSAGTGQGFAMRSNTHISVVPYCGSQNHVYWRKGTSGTYTLLPPDPVIATSDFAGGNHLTVYFEYYEASGYIPATTVDFYYLPAEIDDLLAPPAPYIVDANTYAEYCAVGSVSVRPHASFYGCDLYVTTNGTYPTPDNFTNAYFNVQSPVSVPIPANQDVLVRAMCVFGRRPWSQATTALIHQVDCYDYPLFYDDASGYALPADTEYPPPLTLRIQSRPSDVARYLGNAHPACKEAAGGPGTFSIYRVALVSEADVWFDAFAYINGDVRQSTMPNHIDLHYHSVSLEITPSEDYCTPTKTVTMTADPPDAIIRYRKTLGYPALPPENETDGTAYAGPITVGGVYESNVSIAARAFKQWYGDSPAVSGEYNHLVCAPIFDPNGGTFHEHQDVTMTISEPSDAFIVYTLDGSEPTVDSGTGVVTHGAQVANGASIHIQSSCTLKALGYKHLDGRYWPSTVTSARFTIVGVPSPTFDPPAPGASFYDSVDVYVYCFEVGTQTPYADARIAYTLNGSTPVPGTSPYLTNGDHLTFYTQTTLKAIAYKTGIPDSPVVTATYRNDLPVPQPAFSPYDSISSSGTTMYYHRNFVSSEDVTITCSDAVAEIRYTLNGSDPLYGGTVYDGTPIHVNADIDIKARAFRSGKVNSNLSIGDYNKAGKLITLQVADATVDFANRLWVSLLEIDDELGTVDLSISSINKNTAEEEILSNKIALDIDSDSGAGIASNSSGQFFITYKKDGGKYFLYNSSYPFVSDDEATFSFSSVGMELSESIVKLTFDPSDNLYGYDATNGLFQISTSDGSCTFIGQITATDEAAPIAQVRGIAPALFSTEVSTAGYEYQLYHVNIEFYDNIKLLGDPAVVVDSRDQLEAFVGEDPYFATADGIALKYGEPRTAIFNARQFRPGETAYSYPYGFSKNQTYFPKIHLIAANGSYVPLSDQVKNDRSFSCNKCTRYGTDDFDAYGCSHSWTMQNDDASINYYHFKVIFYFGSADDMTIVAEYDTSNPAQVQYFEINNEALSNKITANGVPIDAGTKALIQLYPGLDPDLGLLCGIVYNVKTYFRTLDCGVIERQISVDAGQRDAYEIEATAQWIANQTTLLIGEQGGQGVNTYLAFRIAVPENASIIASTITVHRSVSSAGSQILVDVLDKSSASVWFKPSGTETGSPVSWTIPGSAGLAQTSPDVSSLLTYFVNRADYVYGDFAVFVLSPNPGTGTDETLWAYEHSSGSAATLAITYRVNDCNENTEIHDIAQTFLCECRSTIFPDHASHVEEVPKWYSSAHGRADTRVTVSTADSLRPTVRRRRDNRAIILWEDYRDGDATILGSVFRVSQPDDLFASGSLSRFDYDFLIEGRAVEFQLDLYDRVFSVYEKPFPVPAASRGAAHVLPHTELRSKICDFVDMEETVQESPRICEYPNIANYITTTDPYVAAEIIRKIHLKESNVQYFTYNSLKKAIPVVNNCRVELCIHGSPEITAFRLRNEDTGKFSDWCQWRPQISDYYLEYDWKLSPNAGLKQVCIQAVTYSGILTEFCLQVIGDYDPIVYEINVYGDDKYSQKVNVWQGIPVVATRGQQNNAGQEAVTVYVEIVPSVPVANAENGISFDVLQQGTATIYDIPAAVATDTQGRQVFRGNFEILKTDSDAVVDGLAQIVPYFGTECEPKISPPAADADWQKDRFIVINETAEEKYATIETDLDDYRQERSGKIGVPMLVRPTNEDPYMIYGDPDYSITQNEPRQSGVGGDPTKLGPGGTEQGSAGESPGGASSTPTGGG